MAGLADTRWKLKEFRVADAIIPPIPGTVLTAFFRGSDQVGGSGGCNAYGAEVKADDGPEGPIAITNLFHSELYCSEPPGVSEQEGRFFAALQAAARFAIDGTSLMLTSKDEIGGTSLLFVAIK